MIKIRDDEPQKSIHISMARLCGMKLYEDKDGRVKAFDHGEIVPKGLTPLSNKKKKDAATTCNSNSIKIRTK